MGCKRCKKRISETGSLVERKMVIYFYCPACENLRAKRMMPKETSGIRCDLCDGKVMKYTKAPSMRKLREVKKQRFRGIDGKFAKQL